MRCKFCSVIKGTGVYWDTCALGTLVQHCCHASLSLDQTWSFDDIANQELLISKEKFCLGLLSTVIEAWTFI